VSFTSRIWTWGAGGTTGPAIRAGACDGDTGAKTATTSATHQSDPQSVKREVCTVAEPRRTYCTMVQLVGSAALKPVTVGRLGEPGGTV
jgi:hypothetical protein